MILPSGLRALATALSFRIPNKLSLRAILWRGGYLFLIQPSYNTTRMLKDTYISTPLALSFLLLLISFGIAYSSLKNVDSLLVIHFVGNQGIDFLGTPNDVFGIIFSGLATSLINIFLINVFYKRSKFFSYLIAFFNIFFSVLILIAVAVIISVN